MLRRAATRSRAASARALASRQRLHTSPICRNLDEHDIITVRWLLRPILPPTSEAYPLSGPTQRDNDMISIEGYSEYGFMVNGVQFRGGLFAFPGFALMWDAHEFQDLTWDSLALLRMLQTPPGASLFRNAVCGARGDDTVLPELLVLGTGPKTRMVPKDVQDGLRGLGVAFEFMSSVRALARAAQNPL